MFTSIRLKPSEVSEGGEKDQGAREYRTVDVGPSQSVCGMCVCMYLATLTVRRTGGRQSGSGIVLHCLSCVSDELLHEVEER